VVIQYVTERFLQQILSNATINLWLNKETKCFMEVEIGVGMYVGGAGRESV
jgi:hypothetical protein